MASVHNPDQYMWNLRQVIGQSRKRIGFLVGAGAPAGIKTVGPDPFIPSLAGLTEKVLDGLPPKYATGLKGVLADLGGGKPNIEVVLSRVRTIADVLKTHGLHGLSGNDYHDLSGKICEGIGSIVDKDLPGSSNPYSELVSWVGGTSRTHPVEIFTTNYDLLFEQAFERAKQPFFDGFTGGQQPFFDPSSVAGSDLPARWARLWKLHGSLGWELTPLGEVIRTPKSKSPYCVFPEHLKYEQTQKAPYSALFDRLRSFLLEKDTLLIVCGFSFADAHIAARISECLAANPAASAFAFQYQTLDKEDRARELALQRSNMSVYARDKAVINGIVAEWRTGEPPAKNWKTVQSTYWKSDPAGGSNEFLLGDFGHLAPFFAAAKTEQGAASAPGSSSGAV